MAACRMAGVTCRGIWNGPIGKRGFMGGSLLGESEREEYLRRTDRVNLLSRNTCSILAGFESTAQEMQKQIRRTTKRETGNDNLSGVMLKSDGAERERDYLDGSSWLEPRSDESFGKGSPQMKWLNQSRLACITARLDFGLVMPWP